MLKPGRGSGEIINKNLQGAFAEIGKIDQDEVLLHAFVVPQKLLNILYQIMHRVRRRAVSDPNILLDPPLGHAAPVLDHLVGQRLVGNRHQGLRPRSDLGRTHSNRLYVAIDLVTHLYPIAHFERTIGNQRNGPEKVAKGLLGSQGDR